LFTLSGPRAVQLNHVSDDLVVPPFVVGRPAIENVFVLTCQSPRFLAYNAILIAWTTQTSYDWHRAFLNRIYILFSIELLPFTA